MLESIRTAEMIFVPRMYTKPVEEKPRSHSAATGILPLEHYTITLNKEAALIGADFTKKCDPGMIRIPIRVISSLKIPAVTQTFNLVRYFVSEYKKPRFINVVAREVVIHFHGGGFISMSNSSHQNYTRYLAIHSNTPVLSIDYKLAPEHLYPEGLEDCW